MNNIKTKLILFTAIFLIGIYAREADQNITHSFVEVSSEEDTQLDDSDLKDLFEIVSNIYQGRDYFLYFLSTEQYIGVDGDHLKFGGTYRQFIIEQDSDSDGEYLTLQNLYTENYLSLMGGWAGTIS